MTLRRRAPRGRPRYFMLCSTVISIILMIPKIKQELSPDEAPLPKTGYATITTEEKNVEMA